MQFEWHVKYENELAATSSLTTFVVVSTVDFYLNLFTTASMTASEFFILIECTLSFSDEFLWLVDDLQNESE